MRPVAEKLAANHPLLTGQRVLDALFPYVFFTMLQNDTFFISQLSTSMKMLGKNENLQRH